MYKENLERFLATQLTYMRNLDGSKDCLERLAMQAFGACSFVNDCLYAAGEIDADEWYSEEWLAGVWQNFRGQVLKEFGLEI